MRNRKQAITEKSDVITLTPTEGAQLIQGLYNSGSYERTTLFRGAPGIGKTTFVRDAAAKLGINYVEINPTMPADEVGGIPDLIRREGHATRTDYAMPSWFPTEQADPDWKGIICLDDALQGDKMMQQTLANLIQARNLRGHKLPRGAMIVATGNRVEDNAGVTRMLSHLADRLTIFNIEADPQSWIDNFALPNGVDERIIAYISQFPDKLNKFDPKADKCCTSRTWAALSTRMAYIDSLKANPDLEELHEKFALAIITGELGMGEGSTFWAFCGRWGKVPNTDAILTNPKEVEVVKDIDIQYATAVAVAKKMGSDKFPNGFANGLEYINSMNPDLTAMAIKLGARENPELKKSEAFADWAMKNQDMIHGYN